MDPAIQERYNQKIRDFCNGIDPFGLKGEKAPLPRNVTYFDVYNYCIEKDSSYTHESFRAYKTLEAYQYYENGWVQSIICKNITTGWIILGKVKHSFRLNLKALLCWVSVDLNGIVLTGHCNCMSGKGEVCSHVGAILFLLEAWGRKSSDVDCPESISCTDVLAKWLVPKMKNVEMASVLDICWTSTASNSTEDVSALNDTIALQDTTINESLASDSSENVEAIETRIDYFLHTIEEKGVLCPLMAMRDPFSSSFVPKKSADLICDLTKNLDEDAAYVNKLLLTSFHDPRYASLPLEDLQAMAEDVELSYTQDQIDYIERETRTQSECMLLFNLRAGRVTGSVFKAVCRTSIVTPAISTIDKICYPERHIFTTKETAYGKRNEAIARDDFFKSMSTEHANYEMRTTGSSIISFLFVVYHRTLWLAVIAAEKE